MKAFLQFDFKGMESTFTNPIEIITATEIDRVPEAFVKIENALQKGYYLAGYVSYEAAPAFDDSYKVRAESSLPLLWFGVFKEKLIYPIKKKEALPYSIYRWKNTMSNGRYNQMIEKIKSLIGQGITYQVNFTTRLKAEFEGDSYSFYKQLLKNQSASYSAYFDLEDFQILSVSPELFFQVDKGKITTKPMKGTIKRGKTLASDVELKEQLKNSKKDQAENVMIVDLLRNDLGRIAKPGTVHVESLFDIETYPTVHQMTSTITAELEKNSVFDWFKALFPCGSITGAPKVETMKYIAELEDTPRDVYCGAIGFITPERQATFNVPIRTVVIKDGVATYGTGGGITWESTSTAEYQELMQKAAVLHQQRQDFSLLESIKLENGHYPLLSYHFSRLKQSADYFQISINFDHLKEQLENVAKENSTGLFKVRLLVHTDGNFEVEYQPINKLSNQIQVAIAKNPVDKENNFLYHKTTNRLLYQAFDQDMPDEAMTTLLWNEDGFITEFTIGNIVLEKNGTYYTPPITDGLLAGTYREKLLNEGNLIEKRIRLTDIKNFDQIWFINSVRGWLKVTVL
ncbi:aminodeoxychorismate synthase component I [Gracilibacillus massiliensis]|uniref:aminodeoxychorismate synthase component I n=1 Tax=Gracilibacillus massiliensis TaxID=1564956 RepID=UPI00071C8C37|nr:aminodeoxychorismate synthase component I [Gracilibacillus massiliensis]